MKTNIIKENKEIADELGIPRFVINEAQRNYFPYHLRHCTLYLECIMALNCVLIAVILALFFLRSESVYYLTAFNGTNTFVTSTSVEQATYIAQKSNTQGNPS
jgi:hypothetical protein